MGMGTSNFVIRWINFLTMIHNRVLGGVEEKQHTIVDLFDLVMHHPSGNLGIHSVGFRFIITNNGSGHNVSGLRYKEYQLKDYSSWFLKQTLKQYKMAKLTPIEAGCCRPPSDCGYPVVNASYYDLSFHPISSNKDCKLYKNTRAVKCYNCESCKAGVAQYMKTEWRVVAIFNLALFVILSIIYFVGCCARRNAGRTRESKV
ncbi:hypothetical protein V6N12_073728 [Hibiscus sabdariffa]|uniref:Tetraspanin-10 n=1 Tax=Hibiscus sabdariffa TaxID=183260 RepID=A0ABR2CVU2_9ROSI